jgi:hypothetical protein
MMNFNALLNEVEQLPAEEKWRLVHHVLRSLESGQKPAFTQDWHTFLQETYGSLKDTPIERADQGQYEERDSLQ